MSAAAPQITLAGAKELLRCELINVAQRIKLVKMRDYCPTAPLKRVALPAIEPEGERDERLAESY